ncbi:MAG: hypothetical protein PHH19_07350 [Eubacteriales bacterium]|nr:hypothetical protein [Eubacteriales bacterium]NCC81063.1 hypothetical protein [Clostridia bacterium]
MEIINVIDELEREIQLAKKMPLTSKILIEEDLLYKYVDALRAHIPEDIRQAQWINKEKERIFKDAKDEAKKIVSTTENKMLEMCDEKEIIKIANQKAKEIVDNANQKSAKIIQGSYQYVDEIMSDLEKRMDKQLKEVRAGKTEIKSTINKYKMKQSGNLTTVSANTLNLKEKEIPLELEGDNSETKVINIKKDIKETL